MKKIWLVIALILVLLLGACSSAGTDGETAGTALAGEVALLDADYDNALSVQGQLALGTVRLEETELAVDEAQAAELLPLWRAMQSLSSSDTTAAAELEAVVDQIQDTMVPAQLEAIAAMALTTETMAEMMESGELGPAGLGRGDFIVGGDGAPAGIPLGGPPGGGRAGGGDAVFIDGGPGGPGGGPVPGGGPAFSGNGELSEDDVATRQAAFEGGDFQERMLMGLTIRLLAEKTGEVIENPVADVANTVYTVVSEATGLSVEELQAQAAEGQTLAEIIEANGGDAEAVRATLVTALEEVVSASEINIDAAQVAADWLGIER